MKIEEGSAAEPPYREGADAVASIALGLARQKTLAAGDARVERRQRSRHVERCAVYRRGRHHSRRLRPCLSRLRAIRRLRRLRRAKRRLVEAASGDPLAARRDAARRAAAVAASDLRSAHARRRHRSAAQAIALCGAELGASLGALVFAEKLRLNYVYFPGHRPRRLLRRPRRCAGPARYLLLSHGEQRLGGLVAQVGKTRCTSPVIDAAQLEDVHVVVEPHRRVRVVAFASVTPAVMPEQRRAIGERYPRCCAIRTCRAPRRCRHQRRSTSGCVARHVSDELLERACRDEVDVNVGQPGDFIASPHSLPPERMAAKALSLSTLGTLPFNTTCPPRRSSRAIRAHSPTCVARSIAAVRCRSTTTPTSANKFAKVAELQQDALAEGIRSTAHVDSGTLGAHESYRPFGWLCSARMHYVTLGSDLDDLDCIRTRAQNNSRTSVASASPLAYEQQNWTIENGPSETRNEPEARPRERSECSRGPRRRRLGLREEQFRERTRTPRTRPSTSAWRTRAYPGLRRLSRSPRSRSDRWCATCSAGTTLRPFREAGVALGISHTSFEQDTTETASSLKLVSARLGSAACCACRSRLSRRHAAHRPVGSIGRTATAQASTKKRSPASPHRPSERETRHDGPNPAFRPGLAPLGLAVTQHTAHHRFRRCPARAYVPIASPRAPGTAMPHHHLATALRRRALHRVHRIAGRRRRSTIPDPTDYAACEVPSDCTVAPASCCGSCGAATRGDAVAITTDDVQPHTPVLYAATTPAARVRAALHRPDARRNVRGATLQADFIDLLEHESHRVQRDGNYRVRTPDCCECNGDTSLGRLIGVSSENAYASLVCDPKQACMPNAARSTRMRSPCAATPTATAKHAIRACPAGTQAADDLSRQAVTASIGAGSVSVCSTSRHQGSI